MTTRTLRILTLVALVLAACGRDGDATVEGPDRAAVQDDVEVAPTGARLEPPVPPDKLPPGVWYCTEGACDGAHWAASKPPPDAACPECKTPLERKQADATPSTGGVCAPGGP
ncbi:MAG: hypothetical protein ACQEXJ_24245 [Myxococcota bacterium]